MPILKIDVSHPLPNPLYGISQKIDEELKRSYHSRSEGQKIEVVVPTRLGDTQKRRLKRRYEAAGWNVRIKPHNRNSMLLFLFS